MSGCPSSLRCNSWWIRPDDRRARNLSRPARRTKPVSKEDDLTAPAKIAPEPGGPDTEPTYVLEGREALTPVFEALNQYQATTHFNGQSTVVLGGERATGESYTIAHHLFTADGERKIMIASLRYLGLGGSKRLGGRWSEPRTPGGGSPGRGFLSAGFRRR